MLPRDTSDVRGPRSQYFVFQELQARFHVSSAFFFRWCSRLLQSNSTRPSHGHLTRRIKPRTAVDPPFYVQSFPCCGRIKETRPARKASVNIFEHEVFGAKPPQIGRSSDNRRFRSPNYSAWRRSRTESLLSNARYFISSPPCARFARALGAPRTALSATPPLGAGAV